MPGKHRKRGQRQRRRHRASQIRRTERNRIIKEYIQELIVMSRLRRFTLGITLNHRPMINQLQYYRDVILRKINVELHGKERLAAIQMIVKALPDERFMEGTFAREPHVWYYDGQSVLSRWLDFELPGVLFSTYGWIRRDLIKK